ncbi:hypothetical protein [Stakelama pacifica]|uniref:Lipoprotein n=1 Tax=Stakelama pacifica TaxID=517720 RepID=A0A4R6FPZ9_9SPHN|nr:hypothetical protein [Stakelama pacifica]TDN83776.1 hypothetical protein EV664_104262 [Stakelama pacifica]GGO94791.1 hypothetical protein GCM10011329_17510 [Stakelama pacifica]
MKALAAILFGGALVAGCSGSVIPGARPGGGMEVTPTESTAGLEKVIGHDARSLEKLFGTPDADQTEGMGRKLQFGSDICVLDAYLYPPRGGGVPVVAHVDARQRNGAPIDRASCVAALTRRGGGR